MRSQVKIAQKGIEARRRKRVAWAASLGISALAVAFFGIAWLSHARFMSVSEIEVSGNSRIATDSIVRATEEAMSGGYLGLFSKANIFIYPKAAVREAIAAMPAAKSIEIEGLGLTKLHIEVEERDEEARWCSDAEGCFSVDENGLIFDRSSSPTMLAYRGEPRGEPIGTYVMASGDFRRMQFFLRELGKIGADPREVWFKEAGYVDVVLASGGTLIVNSTDDLSDTLSNLSIVLSDRSIAPSAESLLSSIEYIRLDSGNKVFYKIR